MSGKLFVVATPIGNMDDVTIRAINTLKSVDIIFAETPAHSRRFLDYHNIDKKPIKYNDYNHQSMIEYALNVAENSQSIALITDAGTPTIQDPGYRLVKAFRDNNLEVVPIPGASAAITALSASGLPTDKFLFLGFLPKGDIKKQNLLKSYDKDVTIIIYESPKRILKTLSSIEKAFGSERFVVAAREITKIYEEFIEGSVHDVYENLSQRDSIKGEFVILIKKA